MNIKKYIIQITKYWNRLSYVKQRKILIFLSLIVHILIIYFLFEPFVLSMINNNDNSPTTFYHYRLGVELPQSYPYFEELDLGMRLFTFLVYFIGVIILLGIVLIKILNRYSVLHNSKHRNIILEILNIATLTIFEDEIYW